MLVTVELSSWSDFEKRVQKNLLAATKGFLAGPYVYRGQPDSNWRLETTLERCVGANTEFYDHVMSILRIQSQIETFTDRSWDLPTSQEYHNQLKQKGVFITGSMLAYMQHLRHYGYPSPFLDWTLSPFIAAYFAFRDVSRKAESVSIYQIQASDVEILPSDVQSLYPRLYIYNARIPSRKNKRHFLQQSVYTVCINSGEKRLDYANHEDAASWDKTGETVVKYNLPASERMVALQSLNAHNVNAYSLMGTEESLLESLFLQLYQQELIIRKMYSTSPEEFRPKIL